MKKIVVGLTGASGVIYGLRLIEFLLKVPTIEIHVIISDSAKEVIKEEIEPTYYKKISNKIKYLYDNNIINTSIASGSFIFDSMVVIPCSLNTIGMIHSNISNNLINRVISVAKKERRRIVLMPRETPLSTSTLKQLFELSMEGAIIAPPMPAFYNHPDSMDDIINFTIGKILNLLNVEQDLLIPYQPK